MSLASIDPAIARTIPVWKKQAQMGGALPGSTATLPTGGALRPGQLAFVAIFCATMLLPTLGGQRVLTRHEVFAAEPAREMLHGGSIANWIIPHIAGVPRNVKPPTVGWLIAASMALFHSEAEWVVRLPTGISTVLVSVLIADLAGRGLGRRAGVIAGCIQATFVYALVQGRLAEADMPMAASVCLAMYAFARAVVNAAPSSGRSFCFPILFYFGAGLSFLLKGVGIAFIFAGVGAFIGCELFRKRDWRRGITFLAHGPGILLLLFMLSAWPLAARHIDPNIFTALRRELIGRASGELGDPQPWYFYLGAAPAMLLPWLPFAVAALVDGIRRQQFRGSTAQFLLCWFAPGLLILSCSAWKHHHYLIPMMPPATFAAAAGVELWLGRLRRGNAWLSALLWFGGCIVAALFVWRWVQTGHTQIMATLLLLAIGGTAVVFAAARARPAATLAAFLATAWTIGFAVGFAVLPAFEDYHWSVELAKRANSRVPAGRTIYLLDLKEHNTTFYLRFPIARFDHIERLDADSALALADVYALCGESLVPLLRQRKPHGWADRIDVSVSELDRAREIHKPDSIGDRPVLIHIMIRPVVQNRAIQSTMNARTTGDE